MIQARTNPAWDAALRQAYEEVAREHEVSADAIAETDAYRDLLFQRIHELDASIDWSKDEACKRLTSLRRRKNNLKTLRMILSEKRSEPKVG
jgi:hypothetical protein